MRKKTIQIKILLVLIQLINYGVGVTSKMIRFSTCPVELLPGDNFNGCSTFDSTKQSRKSEYEFLQSSIFPFVPPYLKFSSDIKYVIPSKISKFFVWKKRKVLKPNLVEDILNNTGFKLKSSNYKYNIGFWSNPLKSSVKIKLDYERYNHVPQAKQLGIKNNLYKNLKLLKSYHPIENFSFLQQTFILPYEFEQFRQAWNKNFDDKLWILKKPGSKAGSGSSIISHWSQPILMNTDMIAQKYLNNPYLIYGKKFETRLYVLVTSFNPLRIYIFKEGITRMSSINYSMDPGHLNDLCMHIPIHCAKLRNGICVTETKDGKTTPLDSFIWNNTQTFQYLNDNGVNITKLWDKLEDMIIKSILSAESQIQRATRQFFLNRYNGYEFFGVDFMLNNEHDPILLEMNRSPEMDYLTNTVGGIKSKMMAETLTVAGYQFPPNNNFNKLFGKTIPTFDRRLYTFKLSNKEIKKQNKFKELVFGKKTRTEYLETILENLTSDDIRQLVIAEDELHRSKLYKRIFPSTTIKKYIKYIQSNKYYYYLFDAWETKYSNNRTVGIDLLIEHCKLKTHLKIINSK